MQTIVAITGTVCGHAVMRFAGHISEYQNNWEGTRVLASYTLEVWTMNADGRSHSQHRQYLKSGEHFPNLKNFA